MRRRAVLSTIAACLVAPAAAHAGDTSVEPAVVDGGQTNVLLDLEALSAAGLDVSGVSSAVIAPGDLGPDSVAFPINSRSADRPTTFAYEPGTLAPFSGTIEHTGQIFFDQQFAVGNLSIRFDAARAVGNKSGFYVESTQHGFLLVAAILFDIENPSSLIAETGVLSIEGNLLVSPELAAFLGNPALAGADVGDALVSAKASAGDEPVADGSRVDGGQTNVLLDLATLSTAGLDLSGVSTDVIAPGDLGEGSVAFPINPRSGEQPTTFVYEPTDLAPFSGSIEHTGDLFFDQGIALGNFSIGFDAARAVDGKSGFFVQSTKVGPDFVAAILFDVENPSALDAQSTTLTIEGNLLVSPELAAFLGNPALAGADVGDARVSATALPSDPVEPAIGASRVEGGQTNVLLDVALLSTAGLDVAGVSPDVIAPGDLGAGSVAFPINARTADQPTTFAYEPGTLAPFSGTIEHTGQLFFAQNFAVGNFSIGFDAARAVDNKSGFFVESTEEGFQLVTAILFDIENPSALDAQAASLSIDGDLLVSPELAAFLGNPALAGVDVGDARVSATALPGEPLDPADFNGDTVVNAQDFFDFVNAFFDTIEGNADFNGNGFENDQDWFDFVTCYFSPSAC